MVRRDEWLLLFIGLPGGSYPVDQIRIMKGMFLLSQEGPREVRGLYRFLPYHYGPFDTGVYTDLDALESRGLIRSDIASGSNRRIYGMTERGRVMSAALEKQVSATALESVRAIKRHVMSLSFLALLQDVYERYPAYAVRSIARR